VSYRRNTSSFWPSKPPRSNAKLEGNIFLSRCVFFLKHTQRQCVVWRCMYLCTYVGSCKFKSRWIGSWFVNSTPGDWKFVNWKFVNWKFVNLKFVNWKFVNWKFVNWKFVN
jgi:hypothetical protein